MALAQLLQGFIMVRSNCIIRCASELFVILCIEKGMNNMGIQDLCNYISELLNFTLNFYLFYSFAYIYFIHIEG